MDFLQAIILGFAQGIMEWLPVSSKAMVALVGHFAFGMSYPDALATAVWLHTGTLLASVIYFWDDLVRILRSAIQKGADRSLLIFLIITTVLTGIIAAPLMFIAFNMSIPEWLFTILIGIFLIAVAFLQKNRKERLVAKQEITPKNAAIAGVAQGLAGLPGFSRSGLTISALLGEGFPLNDALRMSFLMSIPVVAGVEVLLPVLKSGFTPTPELLTGSAVSAVVGYITMKMLLDVAAKINFFKAVLALGILILLLGILLI